MPAIGPLLWVGSAKKDMIAIPDEVQDICGYASHLPLSSYKHSLAKPLKGFGGAGALEVLEVPLWRHLSCRVHCLKAVAAMENDP